MTNNGWPTVTATEPIIINVKTSANCTPALDFVALLCKSIASVVTTISGPQRSHCCRSVCERRGTRAYPNLRHTATRSPENRKQISDRHSAVGAAMNTNVWSFPGPVHRAWTIHLDLFDSMPMSSPLPSCRSVVTTREETVLDHCRWPWLATLEKTERRVIVGWWSLAETETKKKKKIESFVVDVTHQKPSTYDCRTTKGSYHCDAFWRRSEQRIWLTNEVHQSCSFLTSQRAPMLTEGRNREFFLFRATFLVLFTQLSVTCGWKAARNGVRKKRFPSDVQRMKLCALLCTPRTHHDLYLRNDMCIYGLICTGEETTHHWQGRLSAISITTEDRLMSCLSFSSRRPSDELWF